MANKAWRIFGDEAMTRTSLQQWVIEALNDLSPGAGRGIEEILYRIREHKDADGVRDRKTDLASVSAACEQLVRSGGAGDPPQRLHRGLRLIEEDRRGVPIYSPHPFDPPVLEALVLLPFEDDELVRESILRIIDARSVCSRDAIYSDLQDGKNGPALELHDGVLRTLGALQREGLVDYGRENFPGEATTYVLTDAGREALAGETHNSSLS